MMAKPAWACLLSAIVLTFICAGTYAFIEHRGVAQATLSIEHSGAAQAPLSEVETVIGVDTNPCSNTGGTGGPCVGENPPFYNDATNLGTINGCVSVNPNDTFYIDLFVKDVANLKQWDGTFRFDESMLHVTLLTTNGFFLGSNTYGPILQCFEDPDGNEGECTLGTGDTTGAGHSGSGVLGRLKLTAIGPGVSKANLDLRPDGSPISGVQLLDPSGNPVGPVDEYGNFDGTILNAQIAVDEPCPGECLPDVDTDSDGFNDDVECYLPTDQRDACPDNDTDDAWPLDMNMDTFVTVIPDIYGFRGQLGTEYGDPNFQTRLDLNADHYITVIPDIYAFRGHVGEGCS